MLLPAALLCLVLAGCGHRTAELEIPGEIAGADWRTWGTIQAAGTIVRDGEETEVLVCLDPDEAVFFYDSAAQTVFDSAVYPAVIEDAGTAFAGCTFDDQNGDGNSDVQLEFRHADGREAVLVWYWDAENGAYAFSAEASALAEAQE